MIDDGMDEDLAVKMIVLSQAQVIFPTGEDSGELEDEDDKHSPPTSVNE